MLRRKLVLTAFLLATFAGASAATYITVKRPPAADDGGGATTAERAAIAATHGLVRRQGPALSMKLHSGAQLTLTDRSRCGDLPCPADLKEQYRFRGWSARLGGYLLDNGGQAALLPFDEDPALLDPAHTEPLARGALPLPAVPPPAVRDAGLGRWLDGITTARARAEQPLLAAAKGRARREADQLILTLADGRRLVLQDDLLCGQLPCPPQIFHSFAYAGTSPDGRFHLVQEHWDEAASTLLIGAADGHITELMGIPRFSPNGKLAVDALPDLEWSAPNRLELWSLAGAHPRLVFQQMAGADDDSVFTIGDWTDNAHVRLTRGAWGAGKGIPMMLSHHQYGWVLGPVERN